MDRPAPESRCCAQPSCVRPIKRQSSGSQAERASCDLKECTALPLAHRAKALSLEVLELSGLEVEKQFAPIYAAIPRTAHIAGARNAVPGQCRTWPQFPT